MWPNVSSSSLHKGHKASFITFLFVRLALVGKASLQACHINILIEFEICKDQTISRNQQTETAEKIHQMTFAVTVYASDKQLLLKKLHY